MDKIVRNDNLEDIELGLNTLVGAVSSTLGPMGRTVLIETEQDPHPTKDGASVAKNIVLSNGVANMAVSLVRQAAFRTAIEAGDGTTTSVILAKALYDYGKQVLANSNIRQAKQSLDKFKDLVLTKLDSSATQITDDNFHTLYDIAQVSTNGDAELSKLVYSAYQQSKNNTVINVAESSNADSYIVLQDGYTFKKSYLSQYFINNQQKESFTAENPLVLVYSDKIRLASEIMPLLEKIYQSKRPLVIIADSIEGQALSALVANKLRASLDICAISAPAHGDRRGQILEDIAAVLGTTVINPIKGDIIEKVTLDQLGTCKEIIVKPHATTLISTADTTSRKQQILTTLETSEYLDEYTRKTLLDRLAALSNGVATIYVGADTESELRERKDRLDDAIKATASAIESGYVDGGGMWLASIPSKEYKSILTKPLHTILSNAALNPPNKFTSYDVIQGKFYNDKSMRDLNIIDPAKVVRCAVINAVSVAKTLLETN